MKTKRSVILIGSFLLVVVSLLPAFYIITHSFKKPATIIQLYNAKEGVSALDKLFIKPFVLNFEQYIELFIKTPKFMHMFWNEVWIVVPIVVGQIFLALFAAYGFSKLKFRGSDGLFFIYIVVMMMPFQVTLVPNYIILRALKLLNSYHALILPGVFNSFAVFFLKQFMERIDYAYNEAAQIDGAKEVQILFKIIVPLCKPVIACIMMLSFIDYWNMIEQPLVFLNTVDKYPLSAYLAYITEENRGIGFACSVFYMILPVLVAEYSKDYLKEGLGMMRLK